MKNWAANIINSVEDAVENKNLNGFKVCTVKAIKPLVLTYDGVDIGTTEGDTVFVHPLMVQEPINQEIEGLFNIQNFKNSTAYNSPQFQASIEGELPDFIKEFYLFYKNWQGIYLLNVGDMVAVYELGDNNYLVLQKVSQYIYDENNEREE